MAKLLILCIITLALMSCTTLNSSIARNGKKYKVFVVNKKPTQCERLGSVEGVGKEAFEGNSRYTIPMAITDIKRNTVSAGGNVLFIENAYKKDFSYVVKGTCYKCRTKLVYRKRKNKKPVFISKR